MERSNLLDSGHPPVANVGAAKESSAFQSQLVATQQVLEEQEWGRLMDAVTKRGEKLVRHPSVETAQAYRDAVMEFVQRAVQNGLTVHQAVTKGRLGRQKIFMQVEQIDRHLLDLMHSVLQQQQEPIDVLRIVGEIKGLLVSLRL